MDKNEINVSFTISGFDDITHADISELLAVQPTKTYTKGVRKNINWGIVASANAWRIESPAFGINKYALLDVQLDALIDLLIPKHEELKMLCSKYDSEFSFSFFVYTDTNESTPVVHLEKRHVEFISSLNSECDFDIMLLASGKKRWRFLNRGFFR